MAGRAREGVAPALGDVDFGPRQVERTRLEPGHLLPAQILGQHHTANGVDLLGLDDAAADLALVGKVEIQQRNDPLQSRGFFLRNARDDLVVQAVIAQLLLHPETRPRLDPASQQGVVLRSVQHQQQAELPAHHVDADVELVDHTIGQGRAGPDQAGGAQHHGRAVEVDVLVLGLGVVHQVVALLVPGERLAEAVNDGSARGCIEARYRARVEAVGEEVILTRHLQRIEAEAQCG
ncbi:MAG: Uncharacterised protein [Rhodospirillaceae bacterium]|nr:MAG: Uncharacterised protein [Rhodospirillaceae bacterium]